MGTEFVEGWVISHTLGEGAYGEYVWFLLTFIEHICIYIFNVYCDDCFNAKNKTKTYSLFLYKTLHNITRKLLILSACYWTRRP